MASADHADKGPGLFAFQIAMIVIATTAVVLRFVSWPSQKQKSLSRWLHNSEYCFTYILKSYIKNTVWKRGYFLLNSLICCFVRNKLYLIQGNIFFFFFLENYNTNSGYLLVVRNFCLIGEFWFIFECWSISEIWLRGEKEKVISSACLFEVHLLSHKIICLYKTQFEGYEY